MNRIRGHLTTGMAASSLVLALVAGCTDDNPGFFIRGVLAAPTGAAATGCVYTADPTAPTVGNGVLDVAFISSYTPSILVGNQLIARDDPSVPRVDTSRIIMQGAVVKLTDLQGKEIRSFTTLGSGLVDGASGSSPGYGIMTASLVDPEAAKSLRDALQADPARGSKGVLAKFKVFGRTVGGVDIETAEYQLPITVCDGCLVTFPADSVDVALQAQTGKPNCKAPVPAAGGGGAACVPGQDQPIDCRLCQGNPACDPAAP
jgi:hypothetical protein